MRFEGLFNELLHAEDEDDVVKILTSAGYMNDDSRYWIPFSGNEMNWNQIGNQQADPTGALVEKVINGIDAVLMAESFKRGINPQGPHAPKSMNQAVEVFLGVPNGRLENLTSKEQTALADKIHLVAVGTKREPCYMIIDRGEGQTPRSFHDTFLSLKSSNKSKIPFVQGKFSSGGTGILPFCGTKNFQLIISRRNPGAPAREDDPTKEEWGFTLVRRMFPGNGRDISMYVYLAPDGKIPSFKADEIPILPGTSGTGMPSKPYSVGLQHGTCVKLYNYRWKSKSIATTDARYELERYLHSPCLPFRITETRGYKANYYSTTVAGVWGTVGQESSAENKKVEEGFPSDGMLNLPELGQLPYQIALFKENVDPSHFPHGIYFTLNGQVHGQLPANFISTSLKFDYLSDYLLVSVECSEMNQKVLEDFFMASRDRMRRNEVYFSVLNIIKDELRNHAGLREHNALRRKRVIERALTDNNETEGFFQDLLKSDPALASLLGKGTRLITTSGPTAETVFKGRKFPTFFRLLKEPKEGLIKQCPVNRSVRIQFNTDADNNYFTRGDSPGKIVINPPDLCLSSHLWNGEFSTRFQMPWDAKPGERVDVTVTVSDIERDQKASPFVSKFSLLGMEQQDESPEPHKKGNDSARKRQTNGTKEDPVLSLPNIVEVQRQEWEKPILRFDEFSGIRVTHADEEGYVFYINMDNAYLATELIKAREEEKGLVKFWFKYGLTLCTMGVLQEETRRRANSNNGEGDETESAAGVDLQFVSKYCDGLARVIIPVIRRLYRGPDGEHKSE